MTPEEQAAFKRSEMRRAQALMGEMAGTTPNPDPLTVHEPTCCDYACYEDPGCMCDGCGGPTADTRSGAWLPAPLLAAFVAGIAVGRIVG